MSSEVMRYRLEHNTPAREVQPGRDINILRGTVMVTEADHGRTIDALLAERDARLLQIDTLAEWYSNSLDVINEITAALPGAHYMDPPDGGDVSVPEQVRRMAKDAERYRWLREFIDQSPQAIEHLACSDGDLIDDVIDAALQGA